ncbi:hypothetical protein NBT05_05990 [Aquimarina sp. ERC-38]|uniref:hypothetical protein n=1 Tax=Aquimarina sp. ERC-38 TaxID=2949996 RepID=UPI002247296A|nr:hypothetical protein [Aquimarina sp. ERC-38]UZO82017.1 hypothetical protein NBT05_05990 [Aquimarina sp. ERC-38]
MKYIFLALIGLILASNLTAQEKIKGNLIRIKKDKSDNSKDKFYNQVGFVLEKELKNKPEIQKILKEKSKDTIFLNFSFFVKTKNELFPGTIRSNFQDKTELNDFLYQAIDTNFEFKQILNECGEAIPQPSPHIRLKFIEETGNNNQPTLKYAGIDVNFKKRRKAFKGDLVNAPIHPNCKKVDNPKINNKCISNELKRYVSNNFKKSIVKHLKKKGCQQKCYALFIINKTGDIDNINVVSSNLTLSIEVARLLKSVKGIEPATSKTGKKVEVLYSLPVNFQF